MTEEELALMGYPAQAFPSAAQQPTPDDLAAMGAGPGVGYPMAVMQGAPAPEIQQFAPQSAAGPQMDPETLADIRSQYPSDPNGLVGDSAPPTAQASSLQVSPSQVVDGPNGPINIPPNTGQDNTYGGRPPQQDATQQSAEPGFYKWAKENFGLERGQQITVQEKLKAMELYSEHQKEQMRQRDPKALLETQKLQGEIAAQGVSAANASQEQVDKAFKMEEGLADVQGKIDFLDKLKTHPGLSTMVGAKGFTTGFMGIPIPGTHAGNFNAALKKVQGDNFLTAFNQLKGAGQITEIEGAKATQAISDMSTSQSEEEFKKSLEDLQGVLRTGMERTRKHYAALPASARSVVGSSPSQSSSQRPTVSRPATLNLKGVMYQLGPDGSYHKATGVR